MNDKLANLTSSITDGEHGSLKGCYSSNGYKVASMENIYDCELHLNESLPRIPFDIFHRIQKKSKVQNKSVLISAVGDVGRVAIVRTKKIDFCFISGVVIINTDDSKLLPEYLYYYLQTDIAQKKIKYGGSVNSIQKHFVLKDANEFYIDYPDIKTQQSIVNRLEPIEQKIIINNQIINVLINKIKDQYSFYISNCSDEIQKVKLSDLLEEDNEKFDSNSKKQLIDLAAMPSSSLIIYNYGDSNKLTTNKTILKKGNILIGLIRPYLKKCLISPIDGVTTGTIGQFKIKDEKLQDFIVGIVTSDSFTNYLISVSTGTKMPVVKPSDILSYQIPIDQSLLRKCNFTNTINEIIILNNENYKLTMLKNNYLNKLFD